MMEILPIHWEAQNGHIEVVKIFTPLTDNPNAPDKYGRTPIWWAAFSGYIDNIDIVKILAPLTDNPNAPDPEGGNTPSSVTKNSDIRRFLESFQNTSKK